MPALEACAHCGAAIDVHGDVVWFGLASGGVLCEACRPGHPHVAAISATDLEAIRLLASPGRAWRELNASTASLAPARETVGAVISHVLGHRPRIRPLLGV
jgi:DNA repair protein RecO (recombination protein O)